MYNQDIHKNLRRNKGGVALENIEQLSPTYVRPPGFSLVPTLLNNAMANDKQTKAANGLSYYHHMKDEMQR